MGALPDLRLAVPAAVLWAGCAVLVALPAAWPVAVGAGVAALIAGTAGVVLRGRRTAGALAVAAVAAALLALGGATIAVRADARRPAVMSDAAARGRAVAVELTTRADVVDERVDADVRRVRVGNRAWAVDVPVTVFSGVRSGTPIGTVLRVTGGLRSAGRGEASSYLVFARGSATVVGRPPPLLAVAGRVRAGLAAASERLPGDGGALLPGLAIGDTSHVGEPLRADLRTASLTHLTAVSGANCAVVVGLALLGLRALGAPRSVRLGTAGVLLGLFVVLVTPQPSVLRAAVMAALVLLALARGRPVRGLPVLALAVVVLLLADPWLARDYGFVLSVLATAGLLVLAAPLARALGRLLPRGVAVALAVPLAAQLACQPVLLQLTPTLPLWGVPANLLAEPAAPLATVLGLVACLLLPLAPPLGHVATALAWVPAAWIAAVAHVSAHLPGAAVPWPPGLIGGGAMAVLTIAIVLLVLPAPRRLRVASAVLVAAAVAGGIGASAGASVATAVGRPGDWQYAECDIGQGDATVIRSEGRIAVVDTGPEPARMRACLDTLGIARIDLIVLTHYDLDHVGGTPAVVGRVDRALIGPSSGADDDRVADSLRTGGAQVEQGSAGLTGRLGQLDWRVLWPPERGVEPGNPASVTLSVTPAPGCRGGCLTGLLLGDLGAESQTRLLGSAHPGRYDVVKVAHHGSADQAPELYRRIRASVGLIGVGADNDYGHPTAFCLGMLADAGTRAFRTDVDGLVLVADAGEGSARVWTQKRSAAAAPEDPRHAASPARGSSVHPAFTPRAYARAQSRSPAIPRSESESAWTASSSSSSSSWWLSRSTSRTASTTPPTRWRPRSPPERSSPGSR